VHRVLVGAAGLLSNAVWVFVVWRWVSFRAACIFDVDWVLYLPSVDCSTRRALLPSIFWRLPQRMTIGVFNLAENSII
jgi:lipid-A-disaccharide synthase-like uncharacterized protein